MSRVSSKFAIASAAMLMLGTPAAAGGLINEGLGDGSYCNCGPAYVGTPADYYLASSAYAPTPVYVVDQGPHYPAPLTSYTVPTGAASPGPYYHSGWRIYGYGYAYGAPFPYEYRYGYGPRVWHGDAYHYGVQPYRYGIGYRGYGAVRAQARGTAVHPGVRPRRAVHHGMRGARGPVAGTNLMGGPGSHAHPRPAPQGLPKRGR